jgi:predicted nucleotidyltransferase
MSRDETIAVLRAHADELRSRGVTRLALFGSDLRGDERPDSDIDVLVDFDPSRDLSLIDVAELRLRLSDLLGRQVDLVQRDRLKPHLREAIVAEARDVL